MDRLQHPQLSVDVSAAGGRPLVKIAGRLDGWHYPAVEESLRGQLTPESDAILIDLNDLKFASIGGMYALVEVLQSVQRDVKIFVIAKGDVARVIHRTRFDLRVSLSRTLEEAAALANTESSELTAKLLRFTPDPEDGRPAA